MRLAGYRAAGIQSVGQRNVEQPVRTSPHVAHRRSQRLVALGRLLLLEEDQRLEVAPLGADPPGNGKIGLPRQAKRPAAGRIGTIALTLFEAFVGDGTVYVEKSFFIIGYIFLAFGAVGLLFMAEMQLFFVVGVFVASGLQGIKSSIAEGITGDLATEIL